jgi:hypothetical protein
MSWIRSHWRNISTGLMLATLAGLGGNELYRSLRGDCCQPGAACCHPGSPCCNGAHAQSLAAR